LAYLWPASQERFGDSAGKFSKRGVKKVVLADKWRVLIFFLTKAIDLDNINKNIGVKQKFDLICQS
jgi:hypothetical protein